MGHEYSPRVRNAEHFKTAIYFHYGALDLYPHERRKSHEEQWHEPAKTTSTIASSATLRSAQLITEEER